VDVASPPTEFMKGYVTSATPDQKELVLFFARLKNRMDAALAILKEYVKPV
jgi:hypothetical protein